MEDISLINTIIVESFAKGYYIDGQDVVSPRGNKLSKKIKNGYYKVTLGTKPKRKEINLHKVIAYSKYGDELFKHECVRHLDGDSINNHPDNLVVGTQKQNMLDRCPEERLKHARKAAKKKRKLSSADVDALRNDRAAGMSLKDLSSKYGIANSTISYIINGKTYQT